METRLQILRPSGDVEEQTVKLAAEPGYEALRDLIAPFLDGGRLEHVAVLHDGRRTDMFVDEDFFEKRLERNEAATAIYRANWLSQHPDVDPETLSWIAGTAVLFDRRVWF